MKYSVLVVFVLALAAPAAQAGGFNLTWGTGCWQDNPATLNTFACDSNDGSVSFTVSFATDKDLRDLGLIQVELDLQSDSPELPDWWQLTDPGGCRQGSLAISADISATPGGCADLWRGLQPTYEYHRWFTAMLPDGATGIPANRAKFAASYGIEPPIGILPRGIEYYAFTVTINFAKTAGAGACGGCSTPVTIVLNRVSLYGAGSINLRTPIQNQCLRWQAGGVTPCSATPTGSSTWGQIKSLYR
ncbi:MAG: hypothetical protein A2V63_12485 [Candidatus Eisenbacteria bacterium RBG_19FT_COMBO_70_11]|nr:MAG: hypothetical protein A2V63_12485 [Candidatus Eisenbacteria bacterium RBG_19FT_COMBO_70_11]